MHHRKTISLRSSRVGAYLLVVAVLLGVSMTACGNQDADPAQGRAHATVTDTLTVLAEHPAQPAVSPVAPTETIERFAPGSATPQLVTPGSPEHDLYMSTVNAERPGPAQEVLVSCSSKDGVYDCYCGGRSCCRTKHSCKCC